MDVPMEPVLLKIIDKINKKTGQNYVKSTETKHIFIPSEALLLLMLPTQNS